ncbi:MAG: DUF3106 domain-containing protein [Gammaproteobacteria bacterium]
MKRCARNRFRAAAERFGGVRVRLLTLLLAAPFCASANVVAENSFAVGGVQNISDPFPAVGVATEAVHLADDDDRRRERGRSHQGRRGDSSSTRWDNAEQRNHFEDRRRRFEALPQNQQQRLIRTRERFLHLPPEDRERLRQRWQQMSPEDRRRWRDSGSDRD